MRKVTHSGATLNLVLQNGTTDNYNLDDIVFNNFDAAPVIITNANSLPEFDTLCVGTASTPFSYNITGYQLTDTVLVTAPTHFEISTSPSSGFDSTLILIPTLGNIDTTVYVRFIPSSVLNLDPNIYTSISSLTGTISNSTAGVLPLTVGVLGTGIKSGKWIGPEKGDWVNAANWCGGIPDSTTNVFIENANVTVNNAAFSKSLFFYSDTLFGGASTLSIYGDFNNQGTFIPQTGTIAFRGSNQEQVVQGEFYNLTINKSSGRAFTNGFSVNNNFNLSSDSLIVAPGATVSFSGNANLNNKAVILQSDAQGTARIASLPNAGNDFTGATKVTVERYIPANQKWRALCMPLSSSANGNTIYNHWQNNGSVKRDTGALLWSQNALPGFSLNTNQGASQNIRKYVGGTGFDLLTSTTDAPLFSDGKPVPYLVFVTDYYKKGTNTGNMGVGSASTLLRATGSLYKGNYNSGSLVAGFHMIPNPYPSAINLSDAALTNLDQTFYIWDPLLFGFRGYGGYQTFSIDAGIVVPGGGSYAGGFDGYLPLGSAFWVNSNGAGSIGLTESSKINAPISVFGRRAGDHSVIRVNLKSKTDNLLLDGVAVAFNNNASAEVDTKDSKKFGLTAENIFIRRNNQNLAIEYRPILQKADTIYLGLHKMNKRAYSLNINASNLTVGDNLIPVLEDLYLSTETLLNFSAENKIEFTVNDAPASSGNRFRIVFRQNATTSVNTIEVDKSIIVYPNPAVKGQSIQLSFNNQPAGMYRLVLYDIAGVQVMNKVLQHGGGTAAQSVLISDKLAAGNYVAELTDMKGKSQQIKITIQ